MLPDLSKIHTAGTHLLELINSVLDISKIESGKMDLYLESFSVAKTNQTITFAAPADKTFGDADFIVSAMATSGLPVSFTAAGNCSVTSPSPGTVHLTGAGSCTITASQGGDRH